jgi:hypothetical protein
MATRPRTAEPPEEVAPQPLPPEMATTPSTVSVEDVLRLQDELESHRSAAIQTLLAQQMEIAEKLKKLGYNAPGDGAIQKAKAPVGGKAIRSDAFCKYCQVHGHDARLHRGQGDKKRKFTAAELEQIGKK